MKWSIKELKKVLENTTTSVSELTMVTALGTYENFS